MAESDLRLEWVRFWIVPRFGDVLARVGRGWTVAIDIPIGLPGAGDRGCDVLARRQLTARRSSVFLTPSRAALTARTHREACERNQVVTGKRISIQAFNLLPKIREVDAAMTPELQAVVHEVHPELTFAALAGTPGGLTASKRTPAGERERCDWLRRWVRFELHPEAVRQALRSSGQLTRDDVVDAVACLVSAARIARRKASLLPRDAPHDARGLRMQIAS